MSSILTSHFLEFCRLGLILIVLVVLISMHIIRGKIPQYLSIILLILGGAGYVTNHAMASLTNGCLTAAILAGLVAAFLYKTRNNPTGKLGIFIRKFDPLFMAQLGLILGGSGAFVALVLALILFYIGDILIVPLRKLTPMTRLALAEILLLILEFTK